MFFSALIGTQYKIIQGVTWADIFCVPLLIYVLSNLSIVRLNKDIIGKSTLVYSLILLLSGLVNRTITNTIFLNYTRIFIEGSVAYIALVISLSGVKELKWFKYSFYLYSILYLFLFESSLMTEVEIEGDFQTLDIMNGRNAMAVSNLLIIMMLTFLMFTTKIKFEKFFFILYPFLIFNIFFSASRFSVISLIFFGLFIIYWFLKRFSVRNVVLLLIAVAIIPSLVSYISSHVDSSVMDYSSELLRDKITKNEDGGVSFRINEMNFVVMKEWLNETPVYKWLLGDGISITHGIFSFTLCSTGFIGLFYFIISNCKIVVSFWKKSAFDKYIAFVVFIFFFNDIVTNSRFIIGLNTLIYMGMLAYMCSYDKLVSSSTAC